MLTIEAYLIFSLSKATGHSVYRVVQDISYRHYCACGTEQKSLKFSRNLKANALEILYNLEEMFSVTEVLSTDDG